MEREITYRCGHVERRHVGGYFIVDQDREAARLARRRCAACLAAENRDPPPVPEPLPPLTGSPRQVAWAETIRRRRLDLLRRLDAAAVARAAAVTDARWWIDHRADHPRAPAGI